MMEGGTTNHPQQDAAPIALITSPADPPAHAAAPQSPPPPQPKPQPPQRPLYLPDGRKAPTATIADRFKTQMCRSLINKQLCKYGYNCMFAHNEGEIRTVEMNVRDGLVSQEDIDVWRKQGAARAPPPPTPSLISVGGGVDKHHSITPMSSAHNPSSASMMNVQHPTAVPTTTLTTPRAANNASSPNMAQPSGGGGGMMMPPPMYHQPTAVPSSMPTSIGIPTGSFAATCSSVGARTPMGSDGSPARFAGGMSSTAGVPRTSSAVGGRATTSSVGSAGGMSSGGHPAAAAGYHGMVPATVRRMHPSMPPTAPPPPQHHHFSAGLPAPPTLLPFCDGLPTTNPRTHAPPPANSNGHPAHGHQPLIFNAAVSEGCLPLYALPIGASTATTTHASIPAGPATNAFHSQHATHPSGYAQQQQQALYQPAEHDQHHQQAIFHHQQQLAVAPQQQQAQQHHSVGELHYSTATIPLFHQGGLCAVGGDGSTATSIPLQLPPSVLGRTTTLSLQYGLSGSASMLGGGHVVQGAYGSPALTPTTTLLADSRSGGGTMGALAGYYSSATPPTSQPHQHPQQQFMMGTIHAWAQDYHRAGRPLGNQQCCFESPFAPNQTLTRPTVDAAPHQHPVVRQLAAGPVAYLHPTSQPPSIQAATHMYAAQQPPSLQQQPHGGHHTTAAPAPPPAPSQYHANSDAARPMLPYWQHPPLPTQQHQQQQGGYSSPPTFASPPY